MATTNISDLRPTGSELFSDSESYISELSDSELDISELSDSELEVINGGAFGALPLLFIATVIFAPPAR